MIEKTRPIRDVDCDDHSDVSSLECGSIVPNRVYDPAKDPRNFPFIPPSTIVFKVKSKVEVPQWLRIESYDSPSRFTSNVIEQARDATEENDLGHQVSWDSRIQKRQQELVIRPCHSPLHEDDEDDYLELGWKQTSPTGTLRTSPTFASGNDDASMWLEVALPDQPVNRLAIFQRRTRKFTLRPRGGCLT